MESDRWTLYDLSGVAMIPSDSPPEHATEEAMPKGATLGRYIVLEPLGRGGMGIVYTAYDPELDRKVALKLLRGDPDDARSEQARMLREGQAMARLSHPNVVAVHDVGTYDDRVFVAMELVQGETLRRWLAPGRPWRAIVAMFVQAGRGLAAAHAAGIVHRDFKPDNAIVGADGRVRVLDFGLARAAGGGAAGNDLALPASSASGEASTDASSGWQASIVGTPRYMPPEQIAGERVDASADQFAFCASLWEALYGEPPFEGKDLLALLRSQRHGKLGDPQRRGVPSRVHEAITKGLSQARGERHASMGALLDALENDPAAARRRWLAPGVAVVAVAVAVLGTRALERPRAPLCPSAAPQLASVWDDARKAKIEAAFRATRAPFAEDAIRGTEKALDAYGAQWMAMRTEACEATRVRGEQSNELLDLRTACLADRLEAVRALVDQLVSADAKGVEAALGAADSLPPLSRCADVASLRAPTPLPADAPTRARIDDVRVQLARARALDHSSRLQDALRVAEAAVAGARAIAYAPLEAEALEVHGALLDSAGDEKRAASTLQDATIAAVAGRHEAMEAQAWVDLVHVAATDRRPADGHGFARHAYAALARSPDDERMAALLTAEASIADDEEKLDVARAKLEEALALEEKRLPAEHPAIAATLGELGHTLFHLARYDEAIAAYQRAAALREKVFGPAHPLVAAAYHGIGNALSGKGDYDGALAMYRRALDLRTASHGAESASVADTLSAMGLAFAYSHRFDEGIDAERRALAIDERVLPADHDDLANTLMNLGDSLGWAGRFPEEVVAERRAIAIIEKKRGTDAATLAPPLSGLADALTHLGQFAEAQRVLERALAIEEATASEPLMMASTRHMLAEVLKRAGGDMARAQKLAAQARATYMQEPVGNASAIRDLDTMFPQASRGE